MPIRREGTESGVPPGWIAVWRAPRWQGAVAAAAPEATAAVFVGIAIALGGLLQSPLSPFVRALERLFDRELGALAIDVLGAPLVEETLATVAVPASVALLLLAPVYWLGSRRRPASPATPRAVYFFDDRLVIVGPQERIELPLDPPSGAPIAPRGHWRAGLRRAFVDDGWSRFFEWSDGRQGGFPPAARLWRLDGPDGRPIGKRSAFVPPRLARCPALRRQPDRRKLLASFGRELPWVFFALLLWALPVAAGPYPWVPLLRALGGGGSPGASELAARADAGGTLRTGWLFAAMLEAADDPAVSAAAYRRWLDGYLAAGGAAELHRLERAVVELGRGRPAIGRAWLEPDLSARGLELRLAVALGDRDLERTLAERMAGGEREPSSLLALILLRDGRADEAVRRIAEDPETARERAAAAVLHCLAGRSEEGLRILERPDVAAWRASDPAPESGASPLAADATVRAWASRASARRCAGDDAAARQAWESAVRTAREAGLPGLVDPLRRWIYESLGVGGQGAA